MATQSLTLPSLLLQQAGRWPAREWIVAPGGTLRFGDAPAQAARWAALLAAQGIGRGDRVAVMAGNRIEFVSMVLGCAWLGAVVVPINTASRGLQLEHVLANSGCALMVADEGACAALAGLDPARLALRQVWLLDAPLVPPALPFDCATIPALPQPDGAQAEALRQGAEAVGPGDTLAILYTSGTSGMSKGVCCPHAQFYWWGRLTARNLGIGADDRLYTTLPLFHTNALNACFQALLTGATITCDARFSVSRYFARLAQTRATVTYLLGAMVPMLLSCEPDAAERTHACRIALAPGVPERFHAQFAARTGIALLEGYGSTETNFAIGGTLAEQRAGLMGRVAPEFEACVADADDQPVPDGEPGELLLRPRVPHAIATGYFAMDAQTVQAWRNLWFHTGDRVVRDGQGYFRFLDRLKDAIRRRGENISSYEVEQVLLAHPAVASAAVYAVRSELAEDEVMAALCCKPGMRVDAAELLDFCQPRMPYFSVPRYLRQMDDLPRTENGKIRKFQLRDEGITPDTWDREAAGYRVAR
ncbi:ATP-dependent acyl-CoA ligase [Bordetella genomosp. 1]|uniref:ATP-dependent acyl-CoA ligase n=1 Tax=Bordetella genomosp. 1 TaxID=1395607 RepID=A0A261SQB0_9BORD|nr:ATP-dependent acyl-CoA ligase [Bordetella genomosp. 1]OZI39261.1 ATP-dependent acyl-CoA ligase [Bordetella genomosp. 1]